MSEEQSLTPEQIEAFKAAHMGFQERLAAMSKAVQEEDVNAFFAARSAVCKFATSPEDAEKGITVPPWQIPDAYQMIFINIEIEFILRVFAKTELLNAYVKMAAQPKSGLIIPGRA